MWKFIIILVLSIIWSLKASEDIINLEKHSDTGCNSTIKKNNSAFSLDKHDLSAPCYWTIEPNNTGPISLFFSSVFLHENDTLNIYKSLEDAENGTNSLTEPIHSQNGTLTIITNETKIALGLIGDNVKFDRIFEGYYSVNACSIPVPPEVQILHSPTYLKDMKTVKECQYRFNEIHHIRVKQVFSFMEFNMSSSVVSLEHSTSDGVFTNNPPTDFFIAGSVLILHVKQAINSYDHFSLKIHNVDKSCSGKIFVEEHPRLISPDYALNNGSIVSECRWLITSQNPSVLGLKFDKLDFQSVFDIVSVNDGLSEFSRPLLQVTISNRNSSQNQLIRGSSSSVWISFKPLSYKSQFAVNITKHGQGGYYKNAGSITMKPTTGDDTVFLLEVKDSEIVELDTVQSTFSSATLSVYDGFDTSNLLTSLSGPIQFPILSQSSRMMIIGTNFSDTKNVFVANFKGVNPGCDHMSSLEAENYVLSENCNSACKWIIPPQVSANSVLVVNLQYVSLQKGDVIKIQKLDASLTELGEISANETHVPKFTVPANVGALITVTQAACKEKKDRVVLIGHSSYIPGCNQVTSLSAPAFLQISSPLYPDTYPVFSNCLWNISVSKDSIVHMAFQTLNLADNHCVKISNMKYEGQTLPSDDVFLPGNAVVEFNSSGCDKSTVGNTMKSDFGFLINVTVADCGAIMEGKAKSGEFNTSISGTKSLCIWKVTVPATDDDSVNIISYSVSKKDSLKNYELNIYDGSSVRNSKIDNDTSPEIWSRTNTLIFMYRRLDVSQPSSVLVFKYNTISCNASMQCANKICMHPDWRCNEKDECGDFSDELHCGSVPIPPTNPTPIINNDTGYSATAFWLCAFAMLMIGAVLGVTVPVCYQRYRDSRYRRFQELDS